MEVPPAQLLYIFIDGLPFETKKHLALDANPPDNLAQALTRAKTYQAVTKNGNPVKTLYKQIREESSKPSSAVVENTQNYKFKNLESTLEKLADKVDKIQVNSAQSTINSQRNDAGATGSQNAVQVPQNVSNPFIGNIPFPGVPFQNPYNAIPYNPANEYAPIIAAEIINIGIAVDCIPTPIPAIIFVAEPVID